MGIKLFGDDDGDDYFIKLPTNTNTRLLMDLRGDPFHAIVQALPSQRTAALVSRVGEHVAQNAQIQMRNKAN